MPKTAGRPQSLVMAAAGIAMSAAAGIVIAWMDTRPDWDDTGITVGVLVLVAGLAAIAGTRPWLAAVLVAGPLMIAERLQLGIGMLLVLALALAGAYAGAALRRKVARTAA